ncbi:RING-H2 finger protein ATL63-like [Punica granatum]|uniref:RING-type E3 ubiquitin transferase n=2 Tax=Punica granatum TaxID=22663 RepID=A0A218W7F8_PUNGR|nr:RING-H2 finger protein ATL63-like [Punica granatum]OWM68725.1 hypothetical protein CDL15_Pgr024912 [Punica granatum]PKI73257.1 hypothetical protein CRG98_006350 [Punica granatum]
MSSTSTSSSNDVSSISNNNHHHQLSRLLHSLFSFHSNVMLAAIISLLLVILFVLLLHIYAKWSFLARSRHRSLVRRHHRHTSSSSSTLLSPAHFQTTLFFSSSSSSSPSKGLQQSIISSIPLFVHQCLDNGNPGEQELSECVICLSVFEENEVGRELPKCGHRFHVECIDMWFRSHANCPVCRASVVVCEEQKSKSKSKRKSSAGSGSDHIIDEGADETASEEGTGLPRMGQSDQTSSAPTTSSRLEIVIEYESSGDPVDITNNNEQSKEHDASSSASSWSSSSILGSSLKRMLSRGSSRSENNNIHPSLIS